MNILHRILTHLDSDATENDIYDAVAKIREVDPTVHVYEVLEYLDEFVSLSDEERARIWDNPCLQKPNL
ncbi:MAG: hypothetical protein ACYSUK_00100 [Planctomycetota bacterium]|jgi:hypothetical protein